MTSEETDIVWKRSNQGDANHDEVWDDTALVQAYDKAVNRVKEEIARRNGYSSVNNQTNKNKKNGKKMKWKVGHFCRAVYSEDGHMYEACITSINESDKTCQVQYIGYENEEIVSLEDLCPSLGRNARIKQEQEARIILNGEASGLESSPNSRSTSSLSHRRESKQHSSSHHGQQYRNIEQDPNASSFHHHVHPLPKFPMPAPHLVPPIPPHPFFPPFSKSIQSSPQFPVGPSYSASKLPSIPPPPVFPCENAAVSDEESLASMLMAWYMTGYHTGFYQGLKQSQFRQSSCSAKHTNCCGCSHH